MHAGQPYVLHRRIHIVQCAAHSREYQRKLSLINNEWWAECDAVPGGWPQYQLMVSGVIGDLCGYFVRYRKLLFSVFIFDHFQRPDQPG